MPPAGGLRIRHGCRPGAAAAPAQCSAARSAHSGLWYYKPPKAKAPPLLEVTQFHPTMHGHGGGTWKYYAPSSEAARRRMREVVHPFPTFRSGWSLRKLVGALVTGKLKATQADMLHIVARVVKHVSVYMTSYHDVQDIMSNTLASTIGGIEAHIAECRDAQQVLAERIARHSTASPTFSMRFEVRFLCRSRETKPCGKG